MSENKPTVLCFSGLDPTGAAGIQADIETLFSIGCHCAPVITALTAQNTQNVIAVEATEPSLLVQQARAAGQRPANRQLLLLATGEIAFKSGTEGTEAHAGARCRPVPDIT